MGDCIFCAIASGDIPSTRIYEDDSTFAFLDINPLQTGHTLVIPKEHSSKLEDVPGDAAAALMHTVQQLTPALCEAAGAMDATIAINNGPDAGQEVDHVHVHIVPRHKGDAAGPIHALFADRPEPDADALNLFAETVTGILEA